MADSVPGTPGTGADAVAGIPKPTDWSVGYVLMNWGVNDMQFWPLNEATWKSQYASIIAWAHERYPNANIYLSYPWRVGYDSQAATMHGWVDDLIAANPSYTKAGVDEAITIKAGDNGATNTDIGSGSGVHYTVPAGVTAYAEAMQDVLGF